MRIPITDKFLWDVYNIVTKTANIVGSTNRVPNLINRLAGMENPVFRKYRDDKNKERFRKLIYYLKRKNYIRVRNLEGKAAIILTKEGIDKALKASFKMDAKKRRKDGKWTMLAFDMPARNKRSRNLLRSILQNLGYKIFQQSVWITPYDVSEKTESYLQMYSLDSYVKIFLIEEI
jgi:DNA-binding transcriptional regulator PaaX